MPWTYVNGNYTFEASSSHITRPRVSEQTTGADGGFYSSGESNIAVGEFVEYGIEPSTHVSSFDHGQSVELAQAHVQRAQENSVTVAGVAYAIKDSNGVKSYKFKEKGVVLAWISKRKKRTLDLNGIYNTTVNGASKGKTVIIARDDNFVFLASRDNAVEQLSEKFSALTTI